MSAEKEKKKSYPVINFKGKGSLILTNELLTQIFYLHSNVGNTEWSGILLYDVISGSPANPEEFVLKAKHIHLMDIGSSAFTGYDFDSVIVDLFDAVPDAMNMKIGQVHSHHTMSTFFSGTDTDELMENLDKHNYYLSLIVNMAGTYSAKVAFLTTKKTKSVLSYKSDSGESLEFETEENEEGMGVIEMKILMDYDNKFFYNTYKRIVADKAAKAEAEKKKNSKNSNIVYLNNSTYKGSESDFPSTDKKYPQPFAMTDREVEKLSAYVVSVDGSLKEKNSVYTLLYSLGNKYGKKPEDLLLFYPKLLLDNLDTIITKFFGRTLTPPEKRIVISEIISSVRRFEKVKLHKPIVEVVIEMLVDYLKADQEFATRDSIPTPDELDFEINSLM